MDTGSHSILLLIYKQVLYCAIAYESGGELQGYVRCTVPMNLSPGEVNNFKHILAIKCSIPLKTQQLPLWDLRDLCIIP